MNKKDMNNLADLARLVLEQVEDPSTITSSGDALYNKERQNLRENNFTTTSGDPIVKFYTMRPKSENENDILHNAAGPAVIFGDGGEGNEFYFINDEKIDGPEDPRYVNASNALGAASSSKVQDVFGDIDF